MSAPSARLRPYTLLEDIVLETRDPSGEEKEEVLQTAGTVVWVRRPKAKHLRAFDGHGDDARIAGMIDLMKATVKLDPLQIENLDAVDFDGLGELLSPSKRNGQPTGESASA